MAYLVTYEPRSNTLYAYPENGVEFLVLGSEDEHIYVREKIDGTDLELVKVCESLQEATAYLRGKLDSRGQKTFDL